jgi:hypothetical protein
MVCVHSYRNAQYGTDWERVYGLYREFFHHTFWQRNYRVCGELFHHTLWQCLAETL